jgi:hypothetical protein
MPWCVSRGSISLPVAVSQSHGSDRPAIGVEGHAGYLRYLASLREYNVVPLGAPESNSAAASAGDDPPSVRTECDARDTAHMAVQRLECLTCLGIPDENRLIIAARCQPPPRRRSRDVCFLGKPPKWRHMALRPYPAWTGGTEIEKKWRHMASRHNAPLTYVRSTKNFGRGSEIHRISPVILSERQPPDRLVTSLEPSARRRSFVAILVAVAHPASPGDAHRSRNPLRPARGNRHASSIHVTGPARPDPIAFAVASPLWSSDSEYGR